jgi:hypothetical protein
MTVFISEILCLRRIFILRRGFLCDRTSTPSPFMNRYDKTAPDSSELLDLPDDLPSVSVRVTVGKNLDANSINITPINITKVRPKLTSLPQTMLTDFRLLPTPYGLEIRLPLSRLQGGLMAVCAKAEYEYRQESRLGLVGVVAAALFVGVSVVLTGSVGFGIAVAAVLPGVFGLIAESAQLNGADQGREATLRLVNAPNGETLLSLSSVSQRSDKRPGKRVIHFSNLSVSLVSAKITLLGAQVSFTMYDSSLRKDNRLHICGSRQEVRWLHARIAHWGKGRVDKGI